MPQQLITRLLSALVVVAGVATMVFFLIHLVPGDPVEVMLGESARAADREALRKALHLDLPVHQQWLMYVANVLQGDLGQSLHSKRAVFDVIAERIPATMELACAALLVAITIALPLGCLAALHYGKALDYVSTSVSLLGISIPNFVLGPLLIMLFSVTLGWLPVSGYTEPGALVLPAFTLGSAMAAILTRMLRASLLEVLNEDYIRTARAKGLLPLAVLWRHALPNAMLPVITLIGLQLGALLAGAVITEVVFSWPGLGLLTIDAISKRDYPLVQGCVLLISVTYVVVNMLTDVAYRQIDPRIRVHE